MVAELLARRSLVSASPEATEALAEVLAEGLVAGVALALDGDLGAGKTTFVRGLARGLGYEEGVASPTYTLLQAHEGGRLPLFHFDAWMEGREKALFLDGGDEWLRAGGVAVIEWSGRVAEWLPVPRLEVRLRHLAPESRGIEIAAVGERPGATPREPSADGKGLSSSTLAALVLALILPDGVQEADCGREGGDEPSQGRPA